MEELKLVITLPSFEVIIPEGKLTFHYLEQCIFQLAKAIGQHILAEILKFLDNRLQKERIRGTLTNCGKRSKYLLALLGNISYDKHLYRDKEGHYHYLLDEILELKPNQRMSTHYQRLTGLFSYLAGSFRNAETFLKHTLGEAVSHECMRRQVQVQGSTILKEEENLFDSLLQEAIKPITSFIPATPSSEPLYLEIDGTMIHLQKQDKKKAELKLAIIHRGKEKRYPDGVTDAKKLKDKLAHTGLLPGDEFMAQVSLLADAKYQVYDHNLILVGGDGATWIKEGARDYFPNSIYQLCPFHLERRLTQVLSYSSKRRSHTSLLLKQGEVSEAIALLKADREKYPKKAQEIGELITYLINNHEGINTIDRLKERGLPVDTMGAIRVISTRFWPIASRNVV